MEHRLITKNVEFTGRGWSGDVECSCGQWSFSNVPDVRSWGRDLGRGKKPHIKAEMRRAHTNHVNPKADPSGNPDNLSPLLVAKVQTKRVTYEYWVYWIGHTEYPESSGWGGDYARRYRLGYQDGYVRHYYSWHALVKNSKGFKTLSMRGTPELATNQALKYARRQQQMTNGEITIYHESDIGADMSLSRFVADFVTELRGASPERRVEMLNEARRAKQMLDTLNEDIINELMGSLKDG